MPEEPTCFGRFLAFSSLLYHYGLFFRGSLIPVTAKELTLTLLPRTRGTFSRFGLKVNKLRYHCEGYTEQYLAGGTVTIAYNPENVSMVWALEKGNYTEFKLIESRFEGKDMTAVQELQTAQKVITKEAKRDNLQAQIDLAQHIETVTRSRSKRTNVNIKNIRETRKQEQQKHHKDYLKEA